MNIIITKSVGKFARNARKIQWAMKIHMITLKLILLVTLCPTNLLLFPASNRLFDDAASSACSSFL